MSISAFCPNCGAPFSFHVSSSVVTVCESCNTVLARTDRDFEALGKTSDLVQTQSPLQLWLGGNYRGVGFQITGRTQLRHGAGGVWDEWYLAFDDGSWGWLAEAQGRFYLTFRRPAGAAIDPRRIAPGQWIQVGDPPVSLAVAETGEAEMLAGRGEIPYRLEPGKRYFYADLSGGAGEFGTLDFSEQPPALFLGREVTLHELGVAGAPPPEHIPGVTDQDGFAPPPVSVQAVTCDNCGGSLELRAPDRTERVACPYCGAMHDCNQGVLRFLKAGKKGGAKPYIPLGSQGQFEGHTMTVIGFVMRSVRAYGRRFRWGELLLYHPQVGFRWLTCSNGHWSYVAPLPVGEVQARHPSWAHVRGDRAREGGKTYVVFSRGRARVDQVAGEFYWKVEVGDEVHTVDYVRPPYMLSGEATGSEINWSRGEYMTRRQIQARFPGVEIGARDRSGIAPNQPFGHKGVYWTYGVAVLLAFGLLAWAKSRNPNKLVFAKGFEIEARAPGEGPKSPGPAAEPDAAARPDAASPAAANPDAAKPAAPPNPDAPDVIFTEPFSLASGRNIAVSAAAPRLANSWIYLECDLYNTQTGAVYAFNLPIEYYYGSSGGETWSEGSQVATRYLSAIPTGSYVLRLSIERDKKRRGQGDPLRIEITQGVFRWRYWLILFGLITLIPLLVFLYHRSFEKRRWAESDFAPEDDD